MVDGCLRAVGSSLFLKSSLGFGYTITATLDGDTAPAPEVVTPLLGCVTARVPSAHVAAIAGRDVSIGLPLDANAVFPTLLRELEAHAAALHVAAFGVSSASLEDVFMRLVGAEGDASRAAANASYSAVDVKGGSGGGGGAAQHSATQPSAAPGVHASPTCSRRFRALLLKRALVSSRDWRFGLVPLVLVAAASLALAFAFKDQGGAATCPPSLFIISPAQPVTPRLAAGPPYGAGQQLAVTYPAAASASPFNFSGLLAPAGVLALPSSAALNGALSSAAGSLWGGLVAGGAPGAAWPDVTLVTNLNAPLSAAVVESAAVNALLAASPAAAAAAARASPGPWLETSLQPFPVKLRPFDSRDWTPQFVMMGILILTCALAPPLGEPPRRGWEVASDATMRSAALSPRPPQ